MEKPAMTSKLSTLGRLGRSFIKRFIYSQLAVFSGIKIAFGKEQPLISFTVEADPPSIYWVFRIKSSEVEHLADRLDLPSQFSLCPIQCLDTDEPAYLMTVNAYRVSGLAKGMRAEWSVFVKDSQGIPHYMIVDARSSTFSVDPISVITRATTVIHGQEGSIIRTQIGDGGTAFRCTINLPDDAPLVTSSADWVSANDHIYWSNGIRDRTFYDAGLADAQQHRISSEHAEINDGSYWGTLVEPEPVHILILDNPIKFVITPWENV